MESPYQNWRRSLHQIPEIAGEEWQTAAFINQILTTFQPEVHLEKLGGSGILVTFNGREAGPHLLFRAELDALPIQEISNIPHRSTIPGKGHMCGHDGHTAMLLGAAKYLAETRNFAGTIVVIFQPAEEGAPPEEGGGAAMMIEEGVLAGEYAPEAIFGLHVWPYKSGDILYRPKGAMAAVDTFFIEVTGKQTHGSSPWLGVDPILAASQIVTAIQTIPSRQLDTNVYMGKKEKSQSTLVSCILFRRHSFPDPPKITINTISPCETSL